MTITDPAKMEARYRRSIEPRPTFPPDIEAQRLKIRRECLDDNFVTNEAVIDGIFSREELLAMGWEKNTVSRNWRPQNAKKATTRATENAVEKLARQLCRDAGADRMIVVGNMERVNTPFGFGWVIPSHGGMGPIPLWHAWRRLAEDALKMAETVKDQ